MKTTFDIPAELLVRAKKRAADLRVPLRTLVTQGLRDQLGARRSSGPARVRRRIRWVTVSGGLAPGLDVSDRERMHEGLRGR